jgi:hypothetical protein
MDDSAIKGQVLAEILNMAKKKMVSPKKKAEGALVIEAEPVEDAEEPEAEAEEQKCPACGHCF